MANSLTWAADPLKRDINGMIQHLKSGKRDIELLTRFNQAIIQHSGTWIILMSGYSLQEIVLPTGCKETRLTLDAMEIPTFVQLENENSCVKRVYIPIPNPVESYLFRDRRKIHKISKVLTPLKIGYDQDQWDSPIRR